MRTKAAFIVIVLLACGCKKNDVDIDQLNYNPYDADYVGEPLFEVESTFTDSYVDSQGATIPRFNVRTFARTDRLPQSAAYFIWTRSPGSATWSGPIDPDDLFGGNLILRYDNYVSGTTYCRECAIGTNSTPGGSTLVCATAP